MFKKTLLFLGILIILLSASAAFADNIEMLYPLYNYPTWWDSDYIWDDIAAAGNDISITAVINPNNGPGGASSLNSDYQEGLTELAAGGVNLVGYVSTEYGMRDINDVKSEIRQYNDYFNTGSYLVSGIFLDEVSTSEDIAILNYYEELYEYIKYEEPETDALDQVILNHGTQAPEAYVDYADINIVFEGSYVNWQTYVPDAYLTGYDASQFAYLVYDTPTVIDMQDVIDQGFLNNIGWGFVTDDILPNPWDQLPTYWDDEVAYVNVINLPVTSSVPEPTTMLLLGSGLVGLAGFRKRFRKSRYITYQTSVAS